MGEATRILADVAAGDRAAAERLWPLVDAELRSIAASQLRNESQRASISVTALVDEAYVRLVGDAGADWRGRAHFLAVAAGAMRRILVDRARGRDARKRGGERSRVDLDEGLAAVTEPDIELLALDEALEALERKDRRQAKIVELRYFGGLSVEEVAHVLEVSPRTVKGDWALARLWLHARLNAG